MRRRIGFALVGALALVGCGGSSVKLATYDLEFIPLTAATVAKAIFSGPGGTAVVGQANGDTFLSILLGGSSFGFNAQTPTLDILTDVGPNQLCVGYDPDAPAGSGGLSGTPTTWGEDTFGLTLGTDRLRIFAVSANSTMAALRIPATGAASVVRRSGATVTTFTNFTDFRPSIVWDVNDSGKVVGNGLVGTENRAFMSDGTATLVNLGVGSARSVNSAGIVVGTNQFNRPYRTTGGSSTTRAALAMLPGFTIGEATGINDAGVIVGWQAETDSSPKVPVAWYGNGALVDLRDRLATPSALFTLREAVGIDNAGNILVQATSSSNVQTAVILVFRTP